MNSSKFKKTRIFQHSLISSGMENRLYSSIFSGRFLLVFCCSLVQKIRVKLGKRKIFPHFPRYLLWKIACVLTIYFFLPCFLWCFNVQYLIKTGKISCMSSLFRNSHPAIEVLWLLLFVNVCKTQGIVIV